MKKHYHQNGSLEVICGSMFSGKSEELIRRMKRGMYAQQSIQAFKHSSDERSSKTNIATHSGHKLQATPTLSSSEILDMVADATTLVGIDEVQFFDKNIILVIDELVKAGKRVIVAGLDLDFRGVPFGPMPHLLALADDVTKLKAVCMKSGKNAHFSQRLTNGSPAKHSDPIMLIGAEEAYEARSRSEYEIDAIPLKEFVEKYA